MPLTIKTKPKEFWDERNEVFVTSPSTILVLEHSLISISKWEQKHHKPFLHGEKTNEELLDYIYCMRIGKDDVAINLNVEELREIQNYISDPMTATTFQDEKIGRNRQIITSELIYGWMISYGIPFECERWHINRLMTLIRVMTVLNSGEKNKMSTRESAIRQHELNQIRRAKLKTKG